MTAAIDEEPSEVLQLETEVAEIYKDDERKPYFTAEDLANWCHMTAFENLDPDASKLDVDYSDDDEGKVGVRRRIKPPKRHHMLHKINEDFSLEHKGKLYYIFWCILVTCYQIPLHIVLWMDDDSFHKNKVLMLSINFFITVFARTVWFKWLIYLTTLPTYYMPVSTMKMNINKAVVNNGGIHTASAWWLLFDWVYLVGQGIHDGVGGTTRQTFSFFVSSTTLIVLMIIMFFAMPWRDNRTYHEMFEFSHRYGGWFIGGLFLADVLISLCRGGDEVYDVNDTAVYFILAGIFLIVYPWLGILKHYNADTYLFAPSTWVVLASLPKIHFAVGGTAGQIAFGNDGVGEYHSFACLGDLNGDPKKTTMGVARAGDWTTKLIEATIAKQKDEDVFDNTTPNSKICLNRVAAPGFMWLVRNYKRVVCIGTGAGIAPIASFLPNPPCEMMILWVGRNFEETYGPLYNFVAGYHNSILIDTKQEPSESNPYAPVSTVEVKRRTSTMVRRMSKAVTRRHTEVRFGLKRPDLPSLAKAAVELFNADAVFIISGQKPTFEVCHELWKVGVHGYGATWDS